MQNGAKHSFLGFANPTKSRQSVLSLRAETALAFLEDERFCWLSAARVSAAVLLPLLLEREHKGSCLVDMAKSFSEASDVKSTFFNLFSLPELLFLHVSFTAFLLLNPPSPSPWSNPFSHGKHHYYSRQDEIRLSLPQSQCRQKPKREGQRTANNEVCRMPTQQWQWEIQDRAVNHTRK